MRSGQCERCCYTKLKRCFTRLGCLMCSVNITSRAEDNNVSERPGIFVCFKDSVSAGCGELREKPTLKTNLPA